MGTVTALDGVVVAVDGGGSKTDALVATPDGTVVGRAVGPGCSLHAIGMSAAVSVVDQTVRAALADAQRTPGDVQVAHCYLTAVDLPDEAADLSRELGVLDWAKNPVVDNDLFALLRAGTEAPDAAVVVCGTGINAAAVRADGRKERFLALGTITGDWGGGTGIAEAVVHACARDEDGRGPRTKLVEPLLQLAGRSTVAELSIALHIGSLTVLDLVDVVRDVLRLAAGGDEVALLLRDQQGVEIATMAATLLRRLDLLGRPVPVVLGGGILRSRDVGLHDCVAGALHRLAPYAQPIVTPDRPVVGALQLALGDIRT